MNADVLHLHEHGHTLMYTGDSLTAYAEYRRLKTEYPDERFTIRQKAGN